ncbi:MAG: hypothetical protein ACLS8R_02950 [Anaeromassilibacillus sp.]
MLVVDMVRGAIISDEENQKHVCTNKALWRMAG